MNVTACISDAKVKDDLRYSGASPLIVLNILIAFIYIYLYIYIYIHIYI